MILISLIMLNPAGGLSLQLYFPPFFAIQKLRIYLVCIQIMNYLTKLFSTPKKNQASDSQKLYKNTSFSTARSDNHSASSKESEKQISIQNEIAKIMAERRQFLNPMMAVSYKQDPVKVRVGRGQYFYDQNYNKILDCINNVSHIGHCHPYYVTRMQKQLPKLLTNSRFLYDQLMEATHKLLKRFPPELCVVTFVNSGSQANDMALQMAQIHSKRKGVICLQAAYHGITKSCYQISPYKWNQKTVKADHVTVAKSPCTYRGFLKDSKDPENDYAEYIDSITNEHVGAFICEFMQSCAGQIIPPKGLYKKVYEKLKAKGVVTIGDQVQTGFGRIGENFWAFEYYGVVPDIVTVGKAMGNGFPVSAIICTREVAKSYEERGIQFFSTFGANPLAVTAASCVLDVIEWQKLQQNAEETGKYLRQKLEQLIKYKFVGDVRGVGLFQGIDIVKDKESRIEDQQLASKVILMMRAKNILVSRDGVAGNVLKFKPPLVFNKQNVDQLIKGLHEVFESLSQS